MESPVDKRWGAHGWTDHEFRLMLLREPEPFKKIACEPCGRCYYVSSEWEATTCPRCTEVTDGR